VIDATVLIPTHRHAALLPFAVRSALGQEGASIELFVVGDGVEDETRAALEPFLTDPRVRFFDLPKGERHGEQHRHTALAEAAGRIVCYLSDDDLLLPCHVATMLELLQDADFAHSAPFFVKPGDVLTYIPFDLSQEPQQARLRQGGWNAIGLTGAAHTLAAYRLLPWGWRPAPPGVWTDLHMWQQFLDLPNFRGVTGTELTHLHFPSPTWSECPLEERVSSLVSWSAAIQSSAGRLRLAQRAQRTSIETAAELDLWADGLNRRYADLDRQIADLRAAAAIVESSRIWRLRNRLLALRPVRALVARLPAAR
jgi:GalNAc5-diNAcBac-PP-undecaprenol beta-1,3-glucosyltransferase